MNDQDKRAVEGLARCGIDFEGLCDSFPKFARKDIEAIFVKIRQSDIGKSRCRHISGQADSWVSKGNEP